MLVRSDAWKQCKGFDDDFFAHMEEIDLCWRFHNAGFRVSYVPDSVVYHVGGGALLITHHLKFILISETVFICFTKTFLTTNYAIYCL